MADFEFFEEQVPTEISDETDEDIEYLQNLKATAQSFLKVNKFDISDEPNVLDLSHEQFVSYIEKAASKKGELFELFDQINIENNLRAMMSDIYINKESPNVKIFVFFLPNIGSKKTININIIKGLSSIMLKMNCQESLLIHKKNISSPAKEKIRKCNMDPDNFKGIHNIITYNDENFIDISKHSFSPEILKIYRGDEVAALEKENSIDSKKFPKILADDPLVKFYRGNIGNVFELKRNIVNSKSMLNHQIVYRIVTRSIDKKK